VRPGAKGAIEEILYSESCILLAARRAGSTFSSARYSASL